MTMPQAPAAPATYQPTPITVTAIDVPFIRLVGFFFKAALAAIPAVIASPSSSGSSRSLFWASAPGATAIWAARSAGSDVQRASNPTRHRIELRDERRIAVLLRGDDRVLQGPVSE